METSYEHIKYSLVCVAIVFLSNFFIPSLSNGFTKGINTSLKRVWVNDTSEEIFQARYSKSEYRRRPIVLEFQKFSMKKLSIPYQFSFNLINYLSLFLIFLSLPKFQKSVTKSTNQNPFFFKILFLLSMPIIFAFYGSMSTYDDFLQYLFLILFLTHLFNNNHIIAASIFTIACICRETSLVYYFIIGAFFLIEKFDNKLKKALIWVLPGILYAIFITQYLPSELLEKSKDFMLNKRFFAWTNNFQNINSIKESVTIIVIMTGIYIYSLIKLHYAETSKRNKSWYLTLTSFLIINLIIVSFTGLIREARLLFIPIIIVLPFIANEIWQSISKSMFIKKPSKTLLISLIGAALIAFAFYTPNTRGTGYLYKIYALFYFLIFFEIIFHDRALRNRQRKSVT